LIKINDEICKKTIYYTCNALLYADSLTQTKENLD
jgi:hypothetical protein